MLAAMLVTSGLLAVPSGAAPKAAATTCADPSGTVKVGLSYFGGVEQNLGDAGATDLSGLTPSAQATINNYNAGIKSINDAGGLAGCQVKPVIFNFSAASPDFNQESQQECVHFTQDNKVVAVFTAGYETKVAVDCYAKAKTPLFQFGGSYAPTCVDLRKDAGYVYAPTGIATCRFNAFIPLWDKAGLFPSKAKAGILVFDDGSGQSQLLSKIWIAQLKKLGISAETFTFPGATSEATFANATAALGNAVLKFKADGVTTVLFTPSAGQAALSYFPLAQNQGYFPSYGLDSADGLAVVNSVGASAIKKGIAVSWLFSDLPLQDQQALPANPAITSCAAWAQASTTTLTGSSGYCDFINILQAGFKNATKTDAASLKKGIEALGTSFKSSVTYGGATSFSKNHYDGASMAQVLKFDPSSKSWGYVKTGQKAVSIP